MEIAKATQSLTTAADMRETTKMLMQPNANWEEYLTPAPLSIAIMGELVFISSCDDFSINKNPPKNGYKYIQYPDSFRACLMQVCNSGWHAFNEAHKNMDQIRIHTASVPDYMKAVVKVLFNAPDEVIDKLLPNQLENIRTIADECVILADSVEKKYTNVINLIQELLEACVNAEHFYGEELEKVKMKLKETEIREKTASELKEQSKKAMEAMEKQVSEAQASYKEAMDSLPSGWEMIGMDLVEGLSKAVTGLLNGVVNLVSAPVKTACSSAETASDTYHHIKSKNENEDVLSVCCKSPEILSIVESLTQYLKEGKIAWQDLYDQKTQSIKSDWSKDQFRRISESLMKMKGSKLQKRAVELCEMGDKICEELATYKPGENWVDKKEAKLVEKLNKLDEQSRIFDTKCKKKLGSPAFAPTSPMMSKAQSNTEGQSTSQRAADNARFKIEQSREQLKESREAYEKIAEKMEQNQKELTEILVEMQNCKIKEINFDTTIKMLFKGLDAMGRVKEQWEKMVRFFQMISNIVKCSLSKTLNSFVSTADDTKKLSYNHKLFVKDMLYNQAFQASNVASLVHMISGTYTEVSSKYLMDRVSSLGKLMAMDKEKPEFLNERLNLQQSCAAAQQGILQLVLKNKREFERKTDDRMAKIENGLKAILPAASPQETEKIKQIVQAGFGEEEENYY
ncbi:uncharacterized protein LOC125882543 [Epinephelus fuscoguttatus]|uniref:uncharacterized protein LOC125882543 n=1 Tax=Epinephelus fuscoguttatus TaxID=293821 RepID=UPI0020D0A86C|nr:uncharacterized protein LOC125882543 [Epinephelus fuscoguttatus]XP_049422258.1 uncharacterized protein LOC125882543 [Epinephelus fuscoguttatus]XP_049422259.1 uncharacterized protein LOC125882543 [Epinephelus fuscoguttatus]XP_049422260.1 uncharacterized protein LOC125882543 [Epinephelus fuscoguttatus]